MFHGRPAISRRSVPVDDRPAAHAMHRSDGRPCRSRVSQIEGRIPASRRRQPRMRRQVPLPKKSLQMPCRVLTYGRPTRSVNSIRRDRPGDEPQFLIFGVRTNCGRVAAETDNLLDARASRTAFTKTTNLSRLALEQQRQSLDERPAKGRRTSAVLLCPLVGVRGAALISALRSFCETIAADSQGPAGFSGSTDTAIAVSRNVQWFSVSSARPSRARWPLTHSVIANWDEKHEC